LEGQKLKKKQKHSIKPKIVPGKYLPRIFFFEISEIYFFSSSSIREGDSPKGSETPTDRLSPDASIPEPPKKVKGFKNKKRINHFYKMAHYEASQSQKILQCLQNGKYSDINIKVNGDIIPAHKARFNFI